MSDKVLPIYPSLLDSWQWMIEAETLDDYELRRQQLLDAINRVHTEPTEAMSCGTALNTAVDKYMQRRKQADELPIDGTISEKADGRHFEFATSLVDDICAYMGDSCQQVYSEWTMHTMYGDVKLYGYADYVNYDRVYDLKRVTNYTIGKFATKWQKEVYPLTLVNSGVVEKVESFTYLAVEVKTDKNGVISGKLCPEMYKVDVRISEVNVRNMLETAFVPFLINNKELITNEKILSAL